MIERAHVIGAGRVGSALAARLRERGLDVDADEPELVLLCVPDRAIAEVAAGIEPGPWVAHVSGATPLAALDPHARRFGLHPLQTFTRARGPEQLDGAFAAVTAETDEARDGRLLARAHARPRAVRPRRRRARRVPRGRRDRVELPRHAPPRRRLAARGRRRAARGARPADAAHDRERLRADRADRARRLGDRRRARRRDPPRAPRARARCTSRSPRRRRSSREDGAHDRRAARDPRAAARAARSGSCRRWARSTRGHLALFRAAREECDTVVVSLFVNPAQFGEARRPRRLPARRGAAICATAEEAGVDVLFVPPRTELYPPGFQTWVEVTELSRGLEGEHRPGPLPRRRDDLPQALQPRPSRSRLLRPEGRPAGRGRPPHGARPRPRLDGEGRADGARRRRPRPLVAERPPLARRARGRARSPPRARHEGPAAPRSPRSNGLDVDYVEVADFDPPVLAAAVRVGSTRLIDNVVLNEEAP